MLRSATNRYHTFIAAAKKSFYASLVQSSSSKPPALWKTINNILHRTANRSLPTSSPLAALPQLFATYFSDKISKKLHFNLLTNLSSTPAHSLPPSPTPLLHPFTPATLLEIDNLLPQSSDSYYNLDPVPTTVLKKISNAISPTILSIVNLSITTGPFPSTLNSSIISPLLKKPSLNKEDLSNYCPIANLSFISKLAKIIFKKHLLDHLTSNSLLYLFQFAYTKFYSTETTLLSLHDHLSNAISMQQVSCLCLLDISAAFDTLDHSILLHRLSTWFGIFSVSLQWFTSYLSSRTSTVGIPLHSSEVGGLRIIRG